jgi:hypothetical protein
MSTVDRRNALLVVSDVLAIEGNSQEHLESSKLLRSVCCGPWDKPALPSPHVVCPFACAHIPGAADAITAILTTTAQYDRIAPHARNVALLRRRLERNHRIGVMRECLLESALSTEDAICVRWCLNLREEIGRERHLDAQALKHSREMRKEERVQRRRERERGGVAEEEEEV